MALSSLGDALKKRMGGNAPLLRQLETSSVLLIAGEVLQNFLGSENAKNVKPLFIKNRTLTVTCTSSAVSQEIHLNQAKIVEEINQKIGGNNLDRIRYLL